MLSVTQKDIDRFWGYVDKKSSPTFCNGTRCWEWAASRNLDGYGHAWAGKKLHQAHRVSYKLAFGEIPNGLLVLHHCDNPPCVNPEHLFLGTDKENSDDMNRKGRHANSRGESNPRSKLSDEQVAEIRRRYSFRGIGGETSIVLAKEFGISVAQIGKIIRNESWN